MSLGPAVILTVRLDSLKVLDPKRPIREATLAVQCSNGWPLAQVNAAGRPYAALGAPFLIRCL